MKLKKYMLLCTLGLAFFSLQASTPSSFSKPATILTKDPLSMISAQQFLELTPKKYAELTGKKLNIFQKVELKMLQRKVRGMVKRGEVVTMADVAKKADDLSTMNVLGLLLGLILGPVGVVIALILKETGDVGPDVVKWSLYGLLIWLAIVLVVILL